MSTPSRQGSRRSSRQRGSSAEGMSSPVISSPAVSLRRLASSPDASQEGGTNSLFSSSPRGNPRVAQVAGGSDLAMSASSPLVYGSVPSSSRGIETPGSRTTPSRRRVDIGDARRTPRQFNIAPEGGHEEDSSSHRGPQLVLWGTDVVVGQTKEKFREFINEFIDTEVAEDEVFDTLDRGRPLYLQKLSEMVRSPDLTKMEMNCSHLKTFDANLYRQLVHYPVEVLPILDAAANELFFEKYPDVSLSETVQVRPYNADKTKNMRALNPEDINQLITICGMVIRTSNLIPEMREGYFKCCLCHFVVTVELDQGRLTEPTLCQNCNTNHSFALIHNMSEFTDKQIIKLQESPEDGPPGETPQTIFMFVHSDLVDKVAAGDRVTVTGIYRATPQRENPRMRNIKTIYRTHIDVVHFRKLDENRLRGNADFLDLSNERIEMLKDLSTKRDIYERLANALAPSIYEHEDIKKGILLQLFGGTRKDFSKVGRGEFRAELNILLCGDPGTSKSQLLQYVHKLAPRGQYTSGKGSSAVGLTAYVTKDTDTKQLVLQTGALVLSDNGVCCIDEFDKMNESTRSVLHEVMEQQTMSIAKAGIICQLNARASILAAANPVDSQWNRNKTIIENVQLPHTMLSRFDLIFLMLDPQDQTYDRRLANHLVGLYHAEEEDEADEDALDRQSVRDYIAYAKKNFSPQLTPTAGQILMDEYVKMRELGSQKGQVSAYPRQLESLIRLSSAHAKMRMSHIVEVADVHEARRLQMEALKQAAVDPVTGKIDVSILTTGISGAARRKQAELAQALKKLMVGKKVPTLKTANLFEEFKTASDLLVTREMFEDALRVLVDDEVCVVTNKIIRLL